MLEDVILPIDFGGGLDLKTDPKKVVKGKFLLTENGVYTAIDRIQKRQGYDALPSSIAGGGSLVAPRMLKSFGNELLTADQAQLLSYSPSQSKWVSKGSYVSAALSRQSIDQENLTDGYVDSITLGNYTVNAWVTGTVSGVAANYYASIVDNQSGATVYGPAQIETNLTTARPVRCVVLGGTKVCIITGAATETDLYAHIVNLTSGSIGIGAHVLLTPGDDFTGTSFDVVPTTTGASISYVDTNAIHIINIDTSAAVTATATISESGAGGPTQISIDAGTGNLWVYYVNSSSHTIKYKIFSSSLSVVLALTVAATLASPFKVSNMVPLFVSTTTQVLYFGRFISDGATAWIDATYFVTLTQAGSASAQSLFVKGAIPLSKPATVSTPSVTNTYMVMAYRGFFPGSGTTINTQAQIQPTYFLANCSTTQLIPQVAARFAPGTAGTDVIQGAYPAFTPNLTALSSSVLQFSCGVLVQAASGNIAALAAAYSYRFDFDSANANTAVLAGNTLILNGAVPAIYDGSTCTEWGFHLAPEILDVTVSTTGGDLGSGAYSYLAVFQWTDEQGGLHQSATSQAVNITTSTATSSTVVNVSLAYLSAKRGVWVALYRTKVNGTAYFLLKNPFYISADALASNTSFVSINDFAADTLINGNPAPYTFPGSQVLTNSTPPPSTVFAAHNNRLFLVDAEQPNIYWYTKTFQPFVGLSPSGFLTQQIDPKEGSIQALAEMDANLVGFKSQGIFLQAGDGASDTGQGGSLSTPSFIPSAVGCTNPKSVVLTPKGLMFQSESGLYLLDRALGIHYADQYFNGSAVEAYNSQTYTNSRIIPGTSQIRILTASGSSLVYDYIFDKWATFTNHTGYSSDIWQGTYVYLRTDGSIYQQDTTGTYLDGSTAYALRAQTSWLALSTVQNFQRVRILELLGDAIGSTGHGVQMSFAYDFVQSFATPVPYTLTASVSSAPFQYRQFPTQQKCDSLSVLIEEVTTGASGEYLDLTNLSLLAGIKKGIYKLPAGNSVG